MGHAYQRCFSEGASRSDSRSRTGAMPSGSLEARAAPSSRICTHQAEVLPRDSCPSTQGAPDVVADCTYMNQANTESR